MKHLKSYKIFESIEEEISNVRDIFLDLEDKNFSINIQKFYNDGGFSVSMVYPNYGAQALDFKLSNVVDCIKRSNDYMSSLGYRISYTHATSNGGNEIPGDINDWDLDMYVIYLAVFYNKTVNDK